MDATVLKSAGVAYGFSLTVKREDYKSFPIRDLEKPACLLTEKASA